MLCPRTNCRSPMHAQMRCLSCVPARVQPPAQCLTSTETGPGVCSWPSISPSTRRTWRRSLPPWTGKATSPRLNEEYGLPYALLLVPPTAKQGSSQFPEVVKHALKTLEDERTALAYILVNYDTISNLLNEGKSRSKSGKPSTCFTHCPL